MSAQEQTQNVGQQVSVPILREPPLKSIRPMKSIHPDPPNKSAQQTPCPVPAPIPEPVQQQPTPQAQNGVQHPPTQRRPSAQDSDDEDETGNKYVVGGVFGAVAGMLSLATVNYYCGILPSEGKTAMYAHIESLNAQKRSGPAANDLYMLKRAIENHNDTAKYTGRTSDIIDITCLLQMKDQL